MSFEELTNIVTKIKHIIKKHRHLKEEESEYINSWLERFSQTPSHIEENELNNLIKYAKYLEYQLKYRNIVFPFNQKPPIELIPLSYLINEQIDKISDIIQTEAPPLSCWIDNTEELTTTDKNNVIECNKVIAKAQDKDIPLIEFLAQISPHCEDHGELLEDIANTELTEFRELVYNIFTDKIHQVDKILSSRQCVMKSKYSLMEQKMLNRIKIAQNYLKELIPGFNYEDYINDKDYIKKILTEVDKKDIKNKQDQTLNKNSLSTEDVIKQEQFKLKFIKDEIRNREQENEDLTEEYNSLMSQLNEIIKEKQEKIEINIKRNKNLKDKLAGLNITAEENRKYLEKYILGNVQENN